MQSSPLSIVSIFTQAAGVTEETYFQSKLERPTQERLDRMMLKLLDRLWDLSDEVTSIHLAKGEWNFGICSQRGAPGANLSLGFRKDHYSLMVSREGTNELYQFRNEDELNQLIPRDKISFAKRWATTEKSFAETLPRSIAINRGYSTSSIER